MTKTNEHLSNIESSEAFNSPGENHNFYLSTQPKTNHSRRWKHTKPHLNVYCFIGNEKMTIKYNLPLKKYSQKNLWGYWTGKVDDQKKYICNSCLKKILLGRFDDWGIGAENCPEALKHFLIEINNVINGNDRKIISESSQRLEGYEVNPKDIIGLFSGLQQPLNRNREQKKSLEGKNWNELGNEDKFGGNSDLGKQKFEVIERSVSVLHQDFRLRYFGGKRPEQEVVGMEGIQQSSSSSTQIQQQQPPYTWNWNSDLK